MKKFFLIFLTSLMVACAPIVTHHGFNNIASMRTWIEKNTVLKHELEARFGPASFLDQENGITSFYYVSFIKQRFAFFEPKITQRNIIVLRFKGNEYQEHAEYKLEDGKDIQPVTDITPIYGKDLSVIQEILSNVGRFNNLPGQGRGNADGSVLGRIPGGI